MLKRLVIWDISKGVNFKKLLDEKLGEELQEYICNDNVEELGRMM
jgi:predicted house-cleaning noncanonical NTP pyrophosphatase (MazG superfamily)